MPRIVAALLVPILLLVPLRAHAEDADPWLGKDKILHFAAGTTIAAGGYVTGILLFDSRRYALVTGGVLAAAAGIGKELVDLTGSGDPSWRDLAWTGIGAVTGLALAWGNDVLGRGLVITPRGLELRGTF